MCIWIANKFAKFHAKKDLTEVKIFQKSFRGLIFLNTLYRKRRSLLVAGDDDDKKSQRYAEDNKTCLIVRSDKSVVYATNNIECARHFVLLKLTTDRYEASRGLFTTTLRCMCLIWTFIHAVNNEHCSIVFPDFTVFQHYLGLMYISILL